MSLPELLSADNAIALYQAGILILVAGVTAFITAAFGIGGGVLLLAVMASVLPAPALIPVHGLVQLGANVNRAWLTRQAIDKAMVGWFCVGGSVGAGLASFIVVQLPLSLIQFSVALFILVLVWGPSPRPRQVSSFGRLLTGFVTTIMTMFVGATGPLVAAFIHRHRYTKIQLTATLASCMSFQHALKALVFSFAGFAFFDWLPLVIAMALAGMVGTWCGLQVLQRLGAPVFTRVFTLLVSVLAIKLLIDASIALFA